MPWKERLGRMFRHQDERLRRPRPQKDDVLRFLEETVTPALRDIAAELDRHGREAEVDVGPGEVSITVYDGDREEFYYAVKARTFRKATFAFPEMPLGDEEDDEERYHRAVVSTLQGPQNYGIMGYGKEQVIASFMHEYDRQLRWQKPSRPEP